MYKYKYTQQIYKQKATSGVFLSAPKNIPVHRKKQKLHKSVSEHIYVPTMITSNLLWTPTSVLGKKSGSASMRAMISHRIMPYANTST